MRAACVSKSLTRPGVRETECPVTAGKWMPLDRCRDRVLLSFCSRLTRSSGAFPLATGASPRISNGLLIREGILAIRARPVATRLEP